MKAFFAAILAAWSLNASLAGEPHRLDGREIETFVAGTALWGDFAADGSKWAERTTKSGRVLDLLQGGKHVGAWFVAGDRMCYIYFGKPPSQPCYSVARENGNMLFYSTQTGELIAKSTRVEPSKR
jgi:hypothetical protein